MPLVLYIRLHVLTHSFSIVAACAPTRRQRPMVTLALMPVPAPSLQDQVGGFRV